MTTLSTIHGERFEDEEGYGSPRYSPIPSPVLLDLDVALEMSMDTEDSDMVPLIMAGDEDDDEGEDEEESLLALLEDVPVKSKVGDVPDDPNDKTTTDSEAACILCVSNVKRVSFMCLHLACCGTCVDKLEVAAEEESTTVKCPICRNTDGYFKMMVT